MNIRSGKHRSYTQHAPSAGAFAQWYEAALSTLGFHVVEADIVKLKVWSGFQLVGAVEMRATELMACPPDAEGRRDVFRSILHLGRVTGSVKLQLCIDVDLQEIRRRRLAAGEDVEGEEVAAAAAAVFQSFEVEETPEEVAQRIKTSLRLDLSAAGLSSKDIDEIKASFKEVPEGARDDEAKFHWSRDPLEESDVSLSWRSVRSADEVCLFDLYMCFTLLFKWQLSRKCTISQ